MIIKLSLLNIELLKRKKFKTFEKKKKNNIFFKKKSKSN